LHSLTFEGAFAGFVGPWCQFHHTSVLEMNPFIRVARHHQAKKSRAMERGF
jgi:hypothetical protein